jgi:hypothetical protein
MNEHFLHFVWRYLAFDRSSLKSESGECIEILFPGNYNRLGGPDFMNARLRIGDTLWVGHVEIHVNSGDWLKHGHQHDDHYKNVILHVVFTNDKNISILNEGDLPVLVLKDRIRPETFDRYQQWMRKSDTPVVCEIKNIPPPEIVVAAWKSRLLVERIEMKSATILELLEECQGRWQDVFYVRLARSIGQGPNAQCFEQLARAVPLALIHKYRDQPLRCDALLFGMSGLLDRVEEPDEYVQGLLAEFTFLKAKHGVESMSGLMWHFRGVRPQNFPTLRIAQLSAILRKHVSLFQFVITCSTIKELKNLFQIELDEYWTQHYHFGQKTILSSSKKLGDFMLNGILLNAVALVLFSMGRYESNHKLIDLSLFIYENCKAEQNHITEVWSRLGIDSKHSGDSQALIQLYHDYCERKRCLECSIGHFYLSS